MSEQLLLQKKDFNQFIEKLAQRERLVAPVKKEANHFTFEEVKKADEIALKYVPTILPPKKYYMPQCEVIQTFNRHEHTWRPVSQAEETVLFGVHTCDLAGIKYLDAVMAKEPKDINYLARKEKIKTIGLECNEYCDEYASCHVMKNHIPDDHYDLFFTEFPDHFLVEVATPAGEKIVKDTGVFSKADEKHLKELTELRSKKETLFKDEVKVSHEGLRPLFDCAFDSKVWDDIDKRCLSCGNCTNVCPTCYCFDIKDDMELNLAEGHRYRVWDGCQNEEFAKVAGGENFRKGRGERQRHRYMRKFQYPVKQVDMYACTGCGRCSRTCMADINLKETINALAEEKS